MPGKGSVGSLYGISAGSETGFFIIFFYLVIFCIFILHPEDPSPLPVMSIAASE